MNVKSFLIIVSLLIIMEYALNVKMAIILILTNNANCYLKIVSNLIKMVIVNNVNLDSNLQVDNALLDHLHLDLTSIVPNKTQKANAQNAETFINWKMEIVFLQDRIHFVILIHVNAEQVSVSSVKMVSFWTITTFVNLSDRIVNNSVNKLVYAHYVM